MTHFLLNSGDTLYIDNLDEMIACTKRGRKAYNAQMNLLFSVAEETLIDGGEICLATADSCGLNVNLYEYKNGIEFDWCYSFGEASTRMVATINRQNDTYTMSVRYFVFDVYDWDKNAEKLLYDMHASGVARSYLAVGEYETTVSWKKGQRYIENYSDIPEVDYDDLLNIDVKITDSYLDDLLKRMMITYPDMFVEPIV